MARDPFTAKPLPSDPITAVAMDDDESHQQNFNRILKGVRKF
jgi:hypothetical protein